MMRAVHGSTVLARVKDCDSYVTLQVPDPNVPFYRCSITGDLLIVEFANTDDRSMDYDAEREAKRAALLMGIRQGHVHLVRRREMQYAKMVPIHEPTRRNFIYWASTIKGRAYQLGRYATWRPRLQLDDLVKDVRLIEGWIKSPSALYDMEEHERRKATA